MFRTAALLAVILATSLAAAGSSQTAAPSRGTPSAIEKKLLVDWTGGPCMGTLTFRADGTFERRHYSPGNNQLTGTWELRWDALPPTLILKCRASDDPDRVGKTTEVKLVRLDDDVLVYEHAGGTISQYERKQRQATK